MKMAVDGGDGDQIGQWMEGGVQKGQPIHPLNATPNLSISFEACISHRHPSSSLRILARSNICIIEWAADIVSLLPARFLAVNKAVN
jgi:hypothetical protein